jgi:predicted ABC-type ATPase
MIKTNEIIMSHSYSYIYPLIIQMMTTLADCNKSSAYDNSDNNKKLVSDYMVKPFEYSFKGLFAE